MLKSFKKKLIDIKEWEFEYQQRAEQPILLCDWFSRAISTYFASEIGVNVKNYDYIFTDSSKGYNNPKQRTETLKKLRTKIRNPNSLKAILKSSIEIPRSFNSFAAVINKAIKNGFVTHIELSEYWKKMDQGFIKIIPWFWYPWYISKENMLSNRVKNGLEQYRAKIETITDFDEALRSVIFPVKKAAFQLEQKTMYSLVLLARKKNNFAFNKAFQKAAYMYLQRFDWITTFILTPMLPMTYEQLVSRVKIAIKENFSRTFEIQRKANRKNELRAKKILELFKGDFKLLKNIENARELGYVLTAGIEEAYISSSRYLNFMQLVARRIGVRFEDIKFLLSSEIIVALEKRDKISSQAIERRKKGFIMIP